MPARLGAVAAAAALALAGCGAASRQPELRELAPPAAADSFAPHLAAGRDGVLATWLERTGEGRHRVRFSRLRGRSWSPPATVTASDDLFANWADFPGVVETANGSLYAHWLAKTGAGTYAYSIFVARSSDGGATWRELGRLPEDDSQTEHGFVAWVAEGDSARAFWLDGREMASGGPMTLRTARIAGDEIGVSELLDPRVCECCSTDAAVLPAGPAVVYRDRDGSEVRDTAVVRRREAGWTEPRLAAADGWRIEGCPVNGPALSSRGGRAVAAWFTAAGGQPRVRAAFSRDAGESFETPLLVDGEAPLGRVDTALVDGGAWVVWLGSADTEAAVRLLWLGEDGERRGPWQVAVTSVARASGFPRVVAADGRLVIAWVELAEGAPSRVRATVARP